MWSIRCRSPINQGRDHCSECPFLLELDKASEFFSIYFSTEGGGGWRFNLSCKLPLHFSFKETESREGQVHWISLCRTGRKVQIIRVRCSMHAAFQLSPACRAQPQLQHAILTGSFWSGLLAIPVLSTCCLLGVKT